MRAVFEFHRVWGYVALAVNGVVGLAGLAAWQLPRLRGRWLWVATIVAEVALLLQVLAGVLLVSSDEYTVPRFHMFYGFIAFIVIGLAFSYRSSMGSRREMWYGLLGLFLMGLSIRALQQVGM